MKEKFKEIWFLYVNFFLDKLNDFIEWFFETTIGNFLGEFFFCKILNWFFNKRWFRKFCRGKWICLDFGQKDEQWEPMSLYGGNYDEFEYKEDWDWETMRSL